MPDTSQTGQAQCCLHIFLSFYLTICLCIFSSFSTSAKAEASGVQRTLMIYTLSLYTKYTRYASCLSYFWVTCLSS
jgi:hypothetical protein